MKKILPVIIALILGASLCLAGNNPELSSLMAEARQGNTRAMCDLGLVYFHGKGVLKDPFKARCWVQKAHEQGSEQAKKIWETLELWQYSGTCDLSLDREDLPEYRLGDGFTEPETGMTFVWIPGGCFSMGCHEHAGKCGKDEMPEHRVCLEGFWMGVFEVTQGEWQAMMGQNPSRFKNGAEYPVEQVSFKDVQGFVRQLNQETGRHFSLPTEAQWEYACRSRGRKKPYPWGRETFNPEENCGTCNAGEFKGRTAVRGSFPPNDLGLYDMGGNVKEWCRDGYDKNAYAAGNRPGHGKQESSRVVRGGSFADNASMSRCSARDSAIPGMNSEYLGFRLVLLQPRGFSKK